MNRLRVDDLQMQCVMLKKTVVISIHLPRNGQKQSVNEFIKDVSFNVCALNVFKRKTIF